MARILICATYCSTVTPCFAASAVNCSRCCWANCSGVIPRLAASAANCCCIAAICWGDGPPGVAMMKEGLGQSDYKKRKCKKQWRMRDAKEENGGVEEKKKKCSEWKVRSRSISQ